MEFISDGRFQTISYQEKDFASSCIEIVSDDLSYGFHSISIVQSVEWINCYLEPIFLANIAHETVNPDRVELCLTRRKVDKLIHQIGLALKSSVKADGIDSRFYADSMATSLATHLLRYYSTRNHIFREYEDGLSKQKLRQAIEYIQVHLSDNRSLNDIANELRMQYYFCYLFTCSKD